MSPLTAVGVTVAAFVLTSILGAIATALIKLVSQNKALQSDVHTIAVWFQPDSEMVRINLRGKPLPDTMVDLARWKEAQGG